VTRALTPGGGVILAWRLIFVSVSAACLYDGAPVSDAEFSYAGNEQNNLLNVSSKTVAAGGGGERGGGVGIFQGRNFKEDKKNSTCVRLFKCFVKRTKFIFGRARSIRTLGSYPH